MGDRSPTMISPVPAGGVHSALPSDSRDCRESLDRGEGEQRSPDGRGRRYSGRRPIPFPTPYRRTKSRPKEAAGICEHCRTKYDHLVEGLQPRPNERCLRCERACPAEMLVVSRPPQPKTETICKSCHTAKDQIVRCRPVTTACVRCGGLGTMRVRTYRRRKRQP